LRAKRGNPDAVVILALKLFASAAAGLPRRRLLAMTKYHPTLRVPPVIASEAWQSSCCGQSGIKAVCKRRCWIAASQAPRNDNVPPDIASPHRHREPQPGIASPNLSLRAKRGNPAAVVILASKLFASAAAGLPRRRLLAMTENLPHSSSRETWCIRRSGKFGSTQQPTIALYAMTEIWASCGELKSRGVRCFVYRLSDQQLKVQV
jgi:hypothetical protein